VYSVKEEMRVLVGKLAKEEKNEAIDKETAPAYCIYHNACDVDPPYATRSCACRIDVERCAARANGREGVEPLGWAT
jgi:hypothetical protein